MSFQDDLREVSAWHGRMRRQLFVEHGDWETIKLHARAELCCAAAANHIDFALTLGSPRTRFWRRLLWKFRLWRVHWQSRHP